MLHARHPFHFSIGVAVEYFANSCIPTLHYVHYTNFVFLVQLLAVASFSAYVYIWRGEFETAVKSLILSQWIKSRMLCNRVLTRSSDYAA